MAAITDHGMTGPLPSTRWRGAPAGYLPIAEHGIVGDLHTAALVGSDGTIDWFCPDRFDGPSVFGALLDRSGGGFYLIAPVDPLAATKQLYLPDTNVLITRFLSPEGVGEVQDFMPVGSGPQRLVRSVVGVRGALRFRLEVEPRFDYGLHEPQVTIEPGGVVFRAPGQALALGSPLGLEPTGAGARAEFEVAAGERRTFVLQAGDRPVSLSAREAQRLGDETVMFWRRWLRQSSYQGRWREMVDRSALTLKLLTYEPSGAIVAAPTTSLPEEIGGRRNWDYRYALRDFAFSIFALSRLGFTAEATAFNRFRRQISNAAAGRNERSPLDVMYRIDGGGCLAEKELEHLEGYRGSGPVRIGNSAAAAARRLRRAVRLDLPSRASPVDDLAEYEGISVFYAAGPPEAQLCGASRVGVVGGGNSAGQAAVWLARAGALVTSTLARTAAAPRC